MMLYRCKRNGRIIMAVVEFFFFWLSRMGVPVNWKNSAFGSERRMSGQHVAECGNDGIVHNKDDRNL